MKKLLAVLLSLVLVIAVFSGCSSSKEDITGKWKANVNMADVLNSSIAQADPTIGDYINFKSFNLIVNLELNEDGTYKMYVDESTAASAFEGLKGEFKDGMAKYLEATVADSGLDMSIDDILAMTGMNLDDIVDEAFSSDLLDEMIDEMYTEGQYKAQDGNFYTSDDIDEEPASEAAESYKLDGNTLTLDGDKNDEMYDLLYPLVFKRA